jgi:hypothetical protein
MNFLIIHPHYFTQIIAKNFLIIFSLGATRIYIGVPIINIATKEISK